MTARPAPRSADAPHGDPDPDARPSRQPPEPGAVATWVRTALRALDTPYPYVSGHVATGPDDVDITPQRLHPAFHGCLDWHSSVHMQWSLLVLSREYPQEVDEAGLAPAVQELLSARLTDSALGVESGYLRARPSFERPYGWAWAALLAAEAERQQRAPALAELAEVIGSHVLAWLPRQAYPVRHGKHQNDAFALTLLRAAYLRLGRSDVVQAIEARAREWFGADRDVSTADEPSGSDFLSPALSQAVLMRQVLGPQQGPDWVRAFLGEVGARHPQLLTPPTVHDASDGQFVHLAGLALSRAWQLQLVARDSPDPSPLLQAAQQQRRWAAPFVNQGDFMATHWLVSFALLAQLGDRWSGVEQ